MLMFGGDECCGNCGVCDFINFCVVVYLCCIGGVVLDVVY